MDIKKDFLVEQKRLEGQLFWTWNLCTQGSNGKEETWWVFDKEKKKRTQKLMLLLGTTAVKLAFGFCFLPFWTDHRIKQRRKGSVFLWFDMKLKRIRSFIWKSPKSIICFFAPKIVSQCSKMRLFNLFSKLNVSQNVTHSLEDLVDAWGPNKLSSFIYWVQKCISNAYCIFATIF